MRASSSKIAVLARIFLRIFHPPARIFSWRPRIFVPRPAQGRASFVSLYWTFNV
jgi:hypothetical protein